ncbi:MAG: hypothetical protein LUG19_13225 [Desulfovibrio sp.]|uniref:hypothetical protein n=1 Tax=Desulfovibrio sp. TaxID=885 RepID=UPI0025910154|nr:hypothetical protein [Desulfovibrio sp.]MCD7985189.1 hypothetical protein [Desulfovibrio sp.]
MLALILAAAVGVYQWQQHRKEELKNHVAFALIKIAYGVNWARKDCGGPDQYDHIRRRVWFQKLEMGWIDLQCRGKTDRTRPTTHLNDADNHLDEKLELYEDTTNSILN